MDNKQRRSVSFGQPSCNHDFVKQPESSSDIVQCVYKCSKCNRLKYVAKATPNPRVFTEKDIGPISRLDLDKYVK